MNAVENALLEQMENDKFQKAVSDDFTIIDSLIDQKDLDKINKEDDTNVHDD